MYEMLSYTEYPRGVDTTSKKYNIMEDFASTLFWMPSHCLG
jgi:hypothetical protein